MNMESDRTYMAFYYSAPVIPQPSENPFYDPFMDVPTMTDEVQRPGDMFRTPTSNSSLIETNSASQAFSGYKAGKLNWPVSNI